MSVRIRHNGGQIAALFRERAMRMRTGSAGALTAWGEGVRAKATALSQGGISTADLRGIKPGLYSVMRLMDPTFDAIINNQTNQFASSWVTEPALSMLGETQVGVVNTSPVSKFMEGTSKMRVRPVLARAVSEAPPPIGIIRQALADGCRGTVSTAFIGQTYYL
jgi:hypothetical protein